MKRSNLLQCKPLVLSVLFLVVAVINVQAQFHLGAKGGVNVFKIRGTAFDQAFRLNYNAGAYAEIDFAGGWGLQPEILFSQTSYKTGTDFSDIYSGGADNFTGKLSYLSIPLLLSFQPVPRWAFFSAQAGPQYSILLNQDKHLYTNAQNAFTSGEFSFVGGLQLDLGKFMVGGRYVVGMSNVNNVNPDSRGLDLQQNWKSMGWQAYAGFRIL